MKDISHLKQDPYDTLERDIDTFLELTIKYYVYYFIYKSTHDAPKHNYGSLTKKYQQNENIMSVST